MTSLLTHYLSLCKEQHIQEDEAQIQALKKLDILSQDLLASIASPSFPFSLWTKKNLPRGLYIYGGVGRGKSMLMDLFYEHLKKVQKQRYHFHEFIMMIHTELKHIMDANGGNTEHPLKQIAEKIASQTRVICFDEFHIKDITDAMLLSRLMGFLWKKGIVLVATSNFSPDELYKDGYQRNLIVPFFKEISEKLDVYNLNGTQDYRRLFKAEKERYFLTSDPECNKRLQAIFDHLRQGSPIVSKNLTLKKRHWVISKYAGGVAWFQFDEICGQPLGASDYLELTRHVHTVLVSDIPKLAEESLDRVKRLITLIDVLYDRGINFAASGVNPLSELYTGEKEKQLFERTSSRLISMTRSFQ
ncbi:MAG: cell division protein ZapE [Alphaproteobacteria bacterium]|nr:cell division protein ZapE [Alphaproteobacteria bacterium]NCQ67361.1 cell division protein ZapE [Alphaproteobacteria bacterium]NCT06672.1 cell division protein ZapE [Alphaproteobacteria bacterium]